MGMYDYVKCEYELPCDPPEGVKQIALRGELQTKSFGCAMELYTITPEGRLMYTEYVTSVVPEEQRPYWGKPEWEQGGLYQARGMLDRTPLPAVDLDFHGDIHFGAMTDDHEFYDYVARFTHGNLEYIRVVGGE